MNGGRVERVGPIDYKILYTTMVDSIHRKSKWSLFISINGTRWLLNILCRCFHKNDYHKFYSFLVVEYLSYNILAEYFFEIIILLWERIMLYAFKHYIYISETKRNNSTHNFVNQIIFIRFLIKIKWFTWHFVFQTNKTY